MKKLVIEYSDKSLLTTFLQFLDFDFKELYCSFKEIEWILSTEFHESVLDVKDNEEAERKFFIVLLSMSMEEFVMSLGYLDLDDLSGWRLLEENPDLLAEEEIIRLKARHTDYKKFLIEYLKNLERLRNVILDYLKSNINLSELENYLMEYLNSNISIRIELSIMYSFENGKSKTSITHNHLDHLCIFTLMKIIESEFKLNRCQNCGNFFIPTVRSDEIYCNKIFQNGRTCKQVGYENKMNSDEIMKAYRRTYKTKNALKNRNINNNPNAESDFKKWVYAAKIKMEECRNGVITLEEFNAWLIK